MTLTSLRASFARLFTAFCAIPLTCAATEFDMEGMGQALGGWNAKAGEAAEYAWMGEHGYRTYRPRVRPVPGSGVELSVKLDHLRPQLLDDHALMELRFDEKGLLQAGRVRLTVIGHGETDTGWIDRSMIRDDVPARASALLPGYITKPLREAVEGLEFGRLFFASAVGQNLGIASLSVRSPGSSRAAVRYAGRLVGKSWPQASAKPSSAAKVIPLPGDLGLGLLPQHPDWMRPGGAVERDGNRSKPLPLPNLP